MRATANRRNRGLSRYIIYAPIKNGCEILRSLPSHSNFLIDVLKLLFSQGPILLTQTKPYWIAMKYKLESCLSYSSMPACPYELIVAGNCSGTPQSTWMYLRFVFPAIPSHHHSPHAHMHKAAAFHPLWWITCEKNLFKPLLHENQKHYSTLAFPLAGIVKWVSSPS